MEKNPQKLALQRYRRRLDERGMARFEVIALRHDRDLIRALARRLAKGDAEAARIRGTISETVSGSRKAKGGVLAALRRSPLVGAGLDLRRVREPGRKVDL